MRFTLLVQNAVKGESITKQRSVPIGLSRGRSVPIGLSCGRSVPLDCLVGEVSPLLDSLSGIGI